MFLIELKLDAVGNKRNSRIKKLHHMWLLLCGYLNVDQASIRTRIVCFLHMVVCDIRSIIVSS